MRLALCLLFTASALIATGADIIDRVAVTIELQVITESEIMRQIRVTAFLNGEKPDYSAENKRRTADRLVEQSLIRREIETIHYASANKDNSTGYDEFRKTRYPQQGAYETALKQAGVTDDEVREALQWQAMFLEFIDVRFRPGVQVPDAEVRDYYDREFAPKAKESGQPVPSFGESREAITNILAAQRVDSALDRWLGQTRTQTRIRYRDEVFR